MPLNMVIMAEESCVMGMVECLNFSEQTVPLNMVIMTEESSVMSMAECLNFS